MIGCAPLSAGFLLLSFAGMLKPPSQPPRAVSNSAPSVSQNSPSRCSIQSKLHIYSSRDGLLLLSAVSKRNMMAACEPRHGRVRSPSPYCLPPCRVLTSLGLVPHCCGVFPRSHLGYRRRHAKRADQGLSVLCRSVSSSRCPPPLYTARTD